MGRVVGLTFPIQEKPKENNKQGNKTKTEDKKKASK